MMKKLLFSFLFASAKNRQEVEVIYFGRPSEFLMVASERMAIPEKSCTLAQVLDRLRRRGGRWAYELDDSHVVCTLDGRAAGLLDTVRAGVEIGIFSRKSIFEA